MYLLIALPSWLLITLQIFIPKLLPSEFGESLATGFAITFYGFIFYAGNCLTESYQLIKKNNLSRYPIIWLGCWSVLGLRMLAMIAIPSFIITSALGEQFPYNGEDLLLIHHAFLIFGVFLSHRKIRKTFDLSESSNQEENPEFTSEGASDHA
ncbi:hypothetical protein [uncultured Endozoicomonas sp.]|uniref:hypothetical protein n=1 Tax=uncultured Endozoicomonas sp. TaxID=432652 RepID=UPI002628AD83|nr:hypothetical protein [uncultured Endozoicomonas sp.]